MNIIIMDESHYIKAKSESEGENNREKISYFVSAIGAAQSLSQWKWRHQMEPIRINIATFDYVDKKIVFTGSLQSMSRSEAKKIVEAEGGESLSSVTANTDLVVAGEKAGSKLDKARKLGIKILTEEEFKTLIS